MSVSFEQVVDEWSLLVQREEKAAYSVKAASCITMNSSSPSSPKENTKDQNAGLREMICEWCYRVVDHCEIDRDVVGFAISYFDRYVASKGCASKTLIKLVAMTCLYLAAKLHSTRKISVTSMSSLSHGYFRPEKILKMEMCIMKTLDWHLNPPTPFSYLNVVIPVFDNFTIEGGTIEDEISANVIELSRYLVELSVCDDYFMDKKPSCIAYAASLVAMDILAIPKASFLKCGIDYSPLVVEFCTQRLQQVYNLALLEPEHDETAPARIGPSPTTVF